MTILERAIKINDATKDIVQDCENNKTAISEMKNCIKDLRDIFNDMKKITGGFRDDYRNI